MIHIINLNWMVKRHNESTSNDKQLALSWAPLDGSKWIQFWNPFSGLTGYTDTVRTGLYVSGCIAPLTRTETNHKVT